MTKKARLVLNVLIILLYVSVSYALMRALLYFSGTQNAATVEAAAYLSDQTETEVPILLYHHVAEVGFGDAVISRTRMESHLAALEKAGYTTVSLAQMRAFVKDGEPLPEKPVLVTFDDGYTSNYTEAFPLLKERNMKAAIFVIGVSFGKDSYKDTGIAMHPHFGKREAEEMLASGLIEIQSHTFDMHQNGWYDEPENLRESVLMREDETLYQYRTALTTDCEKMKDLFARELAAEPFALSYPHGIAWEEAEAILTSQGIEMTFTTRCDGKNHLKVGDAGTLRRLYRHTVTEDMTAEDLLAVLEK